MVLNPHHLPLGHTLESYQVKLSPSFFPYQQTGIALYLIFTPTLDGILFSEGTLMSGN